MSTSKMDAEAARARAIAEALKASGARSLTELLSDHERHKEHVDKLCAKLEALPKIIKKRRGSDSIQARRLRSPLLIFPPQNIDPASIYWASHFGPRPQALALVGASLHHAPAPKRLEPAE